MGVRLTGKVTLENNVRIKPGFTINFPTSPIVAEEIFKANYTGGPSNRLGSTESIFNIHENYMLAFAGLNPTSNRIETFVSDDYGDTFTKGADYPTLGAGYPRNQPPAPNRAVWYNGGWLLYAYWADNRVSARYTTDPMATVWSNNYPWPRFPVTNDTTYNYGYYGFQLDGNGNFVHFSRLVNGNNVGIMRRDINTGVILDSLVVEPITNSSNLQKLGNGNYLAFVGSKMYYIDNNMTTALLSQDTRTGSLCYPATNDTALVIGTGGSYRGRVYQWTAPQTAAPYPEITLNGNLLTNSTRLAKKSYMWLAGSFTSSVNARLWYSTDPAGTTFSSTYVDLVLPSTPQSTSPGAADCYIKPGHDNWWYGSYKENSTSKIVLFRFQFETTSGNPPE
jgi:hypothetical protein